MVDSSSSSSSSAPSMQWSEFCLELPATVLAGAQNGNFVGISLQGRQSKPKMTLPVYFQSTDINYNPGKDGQGLRIYSPETEDKSAIPISQFSMAANSITIYVGKTSGAIKNSMMINLFLWADPNIDEISLTVGADENVVLKYGWEHSDTGDSVNNGQWFSWGS